MVGQLIYYSTQSETNTGIVGQAWKCTCVKQYVSEFILVMLVLDNSAVGQAVLLQVRRGRYFYCTTVLSCVNYYVHSKSVS